MDKKQALQELSGAAINVADKNKVTPKEVKQYTKLLDNNHRPGIDKN